MILISWHLFGILLETWILVPKAETGRMKVRNSLELMLWSYHRLCYSYLPPLNLPCQLQEVIHGIKIFHRPWALIICPRTEYWKLQAYCSYTAVLIFTKYHSWAQIFHYQEALNILKDLIPINLTDILPALWKGYKWLTLTNSVWSMPLPFPTDVCLTPQTRGSQANLEDSCLWHIRLCSYYSWPNLPIPVKVHREAAQRPPPSASLWS